MRLYVIGPVTGRENLNRAAFEEARAKLERAGYTVTIPHDFIPSDASYELAMRMSLGLISTGRGNVAMLDGWDDSPGARLENSVATACGIEAHCVGAWLLMAGVLPENDNSPEETPNPPSDEALSALTRRMDETNSLLRAVYSGIGSLNVSVNSFMLNVCNGPKRMAEDAMEKAALIAKEAAALYESAGKENQDDRV